MLTLFRNVFAPPRHLILLVIAGWLGMVLADGRARKGNIGESALDALILSMLVAFVAGGRLLFVAAHFAAFVASPVSLLSPNVNSFDTWGALAIAAIVGAIVIQRRQLPLWQTLDLLAPLFAALMIGLSLSHLASGYAFGAEADLPWSIQLWGAPRHPTQLYELLAALLTLCVIWFWKRWARPGSIFLVWLALAAAGRLIVEGFRGDSTLVFGGLRLAQIIAWAVLAAALLGLELLARFRNHEDAPALQSPAPQPQAVSTKKRTAVRRGDAP
jgi:phosphatidylglycerol:prolipoprotein diacylglycerol transferase